MKDNQKIIIKEIFEESDMELIVSFDKDGDLVINLMGNEITIDYLEFKNAIKYLQS